MTWYWWTHWFWITSFSAICNTLPMDQIRQSSVPVVAYPHQHHHHDIPITTNEYGHETTLLLHEPLNFPLTVHEDDIIDVFDEADLDMADGDAEDIDDIFNGHEIIESRGFSKSNRNDESSSEWLLPLSSQHQPHKQLQQHTQHQLTSITKNNDNKELDNLPKILDKFPLNMATTTIAINNNNNNNNNPAVNTKQQIINKINNDKVNSKIISKESINIVDERINDKNLTNGNLASQSSSVLLQKTPAITNSTSVTFSTSSSISIVSQQQKTTTPSDNPVVGGVVVTEKGIAKDYPSKVALIDLTTSVTTTATTSTVIPPSSSQLAITKVSTTTDSSSNISAISSVLTNISHNHWLHQKKHLYPANNNTLSVAIDDDNLNYDDGGDGTAATNDETTNVNYDENITDKKRNEDQTRQSKLLSAIYKENLKIENYTSENKNLLARSASVAAINDEDELDNDLNSEALIIRRTGYLDAGAISGICFAVLGIFCGISAAGIFVYRRRYTNKPQTLSEPDSSGYIDDSTIRENSDEMYSLDNDSFLNSLEAMTIQNYWTENVKHTKL